MKKYLWFLVTFLSVVGLYLVLRPRPADQVLGTESQQAAVSFPAYSNVASFDFNGKNVDSAWYKVSDTFNLSLIANFEAQANAKDVFAAKSCKFLVNAGFYMRSANSTADSKPTGLFVTDGVALRNFIASKLADGVLSVNYFGTPRITRAVPKDTLRAAVQSGPILKENAEYQKLAINEDKEARRIVAGVTGENELYFLVFYDKTSAYSGPLLGDLPDILKVFEQKLGITFADAINLDGGSASAFYAEGTSSAYADGFSLSELSPVGAFFCEK